MTSPNSNSDAASNKYSVQIGSSEGTVIGDHPHVEQHFYNIPSKPVVDRNRERMLLRLSHTYRDLLAQSLRGRALMELGWSENPDAVQNVTNLSLKIAQHEELLLPPNTTIVQVYEDARQELLILGEPGAGKSTLLFVLAEHLVRQAEQDPQCSLPVVLSLSSWEAKRPDLARWMGEQISDQYAIPREIGQHWIEQKQIIPLLDDLDEIQDNARLSCIKAINIYHRDHLLPLVVCSRKKEYEAISLEQRLALQTAVILLPLTQDQIDAVLRQSTKPLDALHRAFQEQPDLQELATTPLMLNIIVLTYKMLSSDNTLSSDTSQTMQQQIFHTYVQRMLDPPSKRYTPEMTKHGFPFLLERCSTSLFFILSICKPQIGCPKDG
jgi:NACHT domain